MSAATNPLVRELRQVLFPFFKTVQLLVTGTAKFSSVAGEPKLSIASDGTLQSYRATLVSLSASRDAALTDAGKIVVNSSSSNYTYTVKQDSDVSMPIGTEIELLRTSTGTFTVAAGTGATVSKLSTKLLTLAGAGAMAKLTKTAANTWVLTGDLTAA